MRIQKPRWFFLSFLLLFIHCKPAVIIFDLGDILVRKNSFSFYRQIGLSKFLGFYNPFTLEKTLFNFLDRIEPRDFETPSAMHKNFVLPQIMCDWLCGTKTNAELYALIDQNIKKHKNIFSTRWERKIVRSIAHCMFTPKKFIKTIEPIPDGVKLLEKCAHQRDEYGNKKHRIYILSNWDAESFQLLVLKNKKIRALLSLCDGIMISGHVHKIKPDTAIFNELFGAFSIDPDTELTIFIDDQLVNIKSAQALARKNLHALHCKDQSYSSIKKTLKKFGVI